MKRRIINHWTAGQYNPNQEDLHHYHYLIDGDGGVHKGVYPIQANDNCKDGEYAAHTGGGNTKRIGIALCGMLGFKNHKNAGKFPLTKYQTEALYKLNAELLLKEGWKEATKENLMTHYEFGKQNPKTSSAGKIDIVYLPTVPHIPADEIGDFIRIKTNCEMNKLRG